MPSPQLESLLYDAQLLLDLVKNELGADVTNSAYLNTTLEQHAQLFQVFFSNLDSSLCDEEKQLIKDYLTQIMPVVEFCEQGKESTSKKLGAIRFRELVVKAYQL